MAAHRSLTYILTRGALGLGVVSGTLGVGLTLLQLRADTLEHRVSRAVQGVEVPQRQLTTIPGTRAGWTGDVNFSITDAPLQLRLEAALPDLVVLLAILAISLMLFGVVLKLQEGLGFTAGSVGNLRRVILVVAGASILHVACQFIADKAVVAHASTAGGYITDYTYNSPNWFNALPGLVVAAALLLVVEAFRQGQANAEEIKGLI